MTFLFAIEALLGGFVRAESGWVALLFTETAGTREHTWIGTVCFGVAVVN